MKAIENSVFQRPTWSNRFLLLIPGVRQIIGGSIPWGLFLGILFALFANLLVLSTLVIPAEFTTPARVFVAIVAVAIAIAGHWLTPRGQFAIRPGSGRGLERRSALVALASALERGEIDENAKGRLEPWAETDLHVAYRLARAADAVGDDAESNRAWERVRKLDPHRIYRRPVARQRKDEDG